MANASYATDGLSGVRLLATSTTQLFTLGQTCFGNNNSRWEYVKANTAITGPGYVCVIDQTTFGADMITTTNGLKGKRVGVAGVAFAALDYGWLQIDGYCSAIRVNTSATANTKMNTTATAGQLDVDATSGTKQIDVITITTANGGAPATQVGNLTNPVVGVTN